MNRKEYIAKFSRAMRWRTSATEAEDIISDYEDMLNQSAPDEPVENRWGDPYETARLLSEPKAYHKWLALFGILSGCLLLHTVWIATPWLFEVSNMTTFVCLLLGIFLSLFCFYPNQKGDCPKALRRSLIGVSVLPIFVIVGTVAFFQLLTVVQISPVVGRAITRGVWWLGVIGTASGVWGLFQARTKDYRWRALYVLGLTSTIVCMKAFCMFMSVDAGEPSLLEAWFIREMVLWCSYVGIGLVGAVLSLKRKDYWLEGVHFTNQKEYLASFSWAVRWRLSASQAEEVISDYTEILSQSTSEDEIEKKWGNPYEAARLLGEPKAYRAWLVVFALLTVCLLLPVLWILKPWIFNLSYAVNYGSLVLGIGLCFYGFRPPKNKSARCPKALIYFVFLLSFIHILMIGGLSALWMNASALPYDLPYGKIAASMIKVWGLGAAAFGMWGLFQARTKDYRWRTLYVLGLTGSMVAVSIYGALTGIEISDFSKVWFDSLIMDWCTYSAAGLVGAVFCLKKR